MGLWPLPSHSLCLAGAEPLRASIFLPWSSGRSRKSLPGEGQVPQLLGTLNDMQTQSVSPRSWPPVPAPAALIASPPWDSLTSPHLHTPRAACRPWYGKNETVTWGSCACHTHRNCFSIFKRAYTLGSYKQFIF